MGTKRRRSDPEAQEEGYGTATDRESKTIQHELRARTAIDKGHKLLFRAFKTARGFERQKLGRRRKTAAGPGPESKSAAHNASDREAQGDANEAPDADSAVARIKAETASLKALDLTHVTTNYLIKSLLKYKEVAESPSLPGFFRRTAPVPKDAASLNVVARLCNSNPVREALVGIVNEVTAALGVMTHATGKDRKKKRRVEKDKGNVKDDKTTTAKESRGGDGTGTMALGNRAANEDRESEFQGFNDHDDEDDNGDIAAASSDDGEADEATIRQRTSLLRASIPEEFEDEAGDESDDEMSRASQLQRRRDMSITASPSRTPSPVPDEAFDADPRERTRRAEAEPMSDPRERDRKGAMTRTALTGTTFLPTLTMGGYISGSESDGDFDADTKAGRDLANKPKSNRRGQRARRAIWEAKYGEKAKHLGSDAKGARRDVGWDAKRGATDGKRFGNGKGPGRGGHGVGIRGGGAGRAGETRHARGPGGEAAKKRIKDDEGPLHPSWIAAKKAKEAKSVVNAPFQGKKVTFD